MKLTNFLVMLAIIGLSGCATYKHLKPNPLPTPAELGYIEWLDKDKPFELKSDKKYFTTFPDPRENGMYLVLRGQNLDQLETYLTRQFDDGKGTIIKLDEHSLPDDEFNVYTMDHSVPEYYWVIENVGQDMILNLEYRYSPIWRFKFETQSAEFQTTLARNTVSKQDYNSLGISIHAEDLDLGGEIDDAQRKTASLKDLQASLSDLEDMLPSHILDSDDAAYRDFVGLKLELEDELQFQDDYASVMEFLNTVKTTRYDDAAFIDAVPELLTTFERKSRLADNVVDEMQDVLKPRLSTIAPQFERVLRSKRDSEVITLPAQEALDLYSAAGESAGSDLRAAVDFINRFNDQAVSLQSLRDGLAEIESDVAAQGHWPSNSFYNNMIEKVRNLPGLTLAGAPSFGTYSSYSCVTALNRELNASKRKANDLQADYRRASNVVRQINGYRANNNYAAISEALKANNDLSFLVSQYPDLDQLSLDQQVSEINAALDAGSFARAESKIRALHEDRNFINYSKIASKKRDAVTRSESRMVTAIETNSRTRVNTFIEQNKMTTSNVDGLYDNPAFLPVYTLTFSSGGQGTAANHNQKMQDYLNGLKHDTFPAAAIDALYRSFSSDTKNQGVEKARAIATHGKYYSGNARKIKNLIAEVDPNIAKWITKPTEYRKIYVLPTNEVQQDNNSYVFKLNLKLPSEARFPVFDVNIKLPREVAKDAFQEKWYESMTLNGKQLKNEGRFTITAPTKESNYECLITPLQVEKEGNNILEVHFNHEAFKVLEVSIMAQRPLIRKN